MALPETDLQAGVFASGEGDAWYQRNASRLAAYAPGSDPVYRTLLRALTAASLRLHGPFVDLGCASGERLSALAPWGQERIGIDASKAAIEVARTRDPAATWRCEDIVDCDIPSCGLLICSYVLHWVPRSALAGLVQRMTQAVEPNGLLVINDFAPEQDVDREYHHLPGSGVRTYKRAYARLFDGPFKSVGKQTYAYDRTDMGCTEVLRRV